jgi:hypothetical protein
MIWADLPHATGTNSIAMNETGWSTSESVTTNPPSGWVQLTYDDFEAGWGNYTDGGGDCKLYTKGKYAHQGNNAADIFATVTIDEASFTLPTNMKVRFRCDASGNRDDVYIDEVKISAQ